MRVLNFVREVVELNGRQVIRFTLDVQSPTESELRILNNMFRLIQVIMDRRNLPVQFRLLVVISPTPAFAPAVPDVVDMRAPYDDEE